MPRGLSIVIVAMLVLAGCGPRSKIAQPEVPVEMNAEANVPPPAIAIASEDKSQIFSYSHALSLEMAKDAVKSRYERARDACLRNAALHCKLLTANLTDGEGAVAAHLEVALPQDGIAGYEAGLLSAVPADKDGTLVRARSTQAQSVEDEVGDNDKKVAQLSKYRDGLVELAKRPNLDVDDFIKVQQELAKTEADLDEALGAKRDLHERIARESLTIDLTQRVAAPESVSPLAQLWHEAGDVLVDSTATMLRFVLQLVPWLPFGVVIFLLLRWVAGVARKRLAGAHSKKISGGG
jgi:hypothetical protein